MDLSNEEASFTLVSFLHTAQFSNINVFKMLVGLFLGLYLHINSPMLIIKI
jgi:hypothetical protein